MTRDGFSGAGSSLAWPALVTAFDRASGVDDRVPFLLNLLAAAVVLVMVHAWFRRHATSAPLSAAALALLVVGVPLAFLPLVGMEHAWQSVAAFGLATAGVRTLTADDDRDRRSAFAWTLVAAFAAVALRYDTASVLLVLLACFVWCGAWIRASVLALCGATPVAAYAIVAARHGWPWLPSVLMKQRLAGVQLFSWHGAADVLGIAADAAAFGARVRTRVPRRSFDALAFASLVVVSLLLAVRGATAVREALGDVDDLYRHEFQLAQFFRRFPIDGALMLNDIGLITYYSDVSVVDAAGLTTVELLDQPRRFDWDRVRRVVRAHGVRVSIGGDPGTVDAPWIHVAKWKEPGEGPEHATDFFAADRDDAAALDRHLRTFADEDVARARMLTFATR